jgi:hypothetical protein
VAKPEVSSDWTEPVMTRVSSRAKKALEQKLKELQSQSGFVVSQAAYVRQVLYKALGIIDDSEESA